MAGEGPAWDVPAFANDRQYVRGGKRLYCIGGDTPALPPAPPGAEPFVPVETLTRTNGLPIGPVRFDLSAERWLAVGPFPGRDLDKDYLGDKGGRAAAVLRQGEAISLSGKRLPVRPVEESHYFKHFKFTGDMKSIDITAVLDRKFHTTGYFYTVIDVDSPRYVRFTLRSPFDRWNPSDKLDARVWLSGQPLEEGTLVALEKGRYPLMIQVSIGDCGAGKIWMAPRFTDETKAYLEKKRKHDEMAAWWPEYEASRAKLFVLGE